MDKNRVQGFVEKTIESLCAEGIDISTIIDRLIDKSNKYRQSLKNDVCPPNRMDYLTWYISFSEKRIGDLSESREIAKKIGIYKSDRIFRLLKLKEKLTHELPRKRVVQFD